MHQKFKDAKTGSARLADRLLFYSPLCTWLLQLLGLLQQVSIKQVVFNFSCIAYLLADRLHCS